jgi:hypothetical protein
MDSPPELLPYLTTNEPYPLEFKPILRTNLAQVALSLAELDDDISQLQCALDAKRQKREKYGRTHMEHSRLESPARKIPHEIWGLIIGFTLGKGPFGEEEFKIYGYLREVCTTWRDVVKNTPDLCRGLVVHLDGPLAERPYYIGIMMDIKLPRSRIEPWLALVSRNHPYHLVLDVGDDEAFNWAEAGVSEFVQQMVAAPPTPAILSINSASAFPLVYANTPKDNQISHLTLDFEDDLYLGVAETPFQEVFPCLETLLIKAPVAMASPMGHTSLRSLTLAQFCGSAYRLSSALLGFPTLRELRLGAPFESGGAIPSGRFIHPALEVLVIDDEDSMAVLRHATFPSLKFFGLNAWGSRYNFEILAEVVPSFFERCSLDNKDIFVGIKGTLTKFTFNLVMANLPLGSRLHLDIEIEWDDDEERAGAPQFTSPTQVRTFTTIFCSSLLEDFRWLADSHLPPGSEPADIYLPKGLVEGKEEDELGYRLLGLGYKLRILEQHRHKNLLLASMPRINVGWKV